MKDMLVHEFCQWKNKQLKEVSFCPVGYESRCHFKLLKGSFLSYQSVFFSSLTVHWWSSWSINSINS